MATVTVYDFPNIIPDSTNWGLRTMTQVFTSPISGDTQTVFLPGAKWSASLTFSNLTQNNARALMAFLVRLRGPGGRFWLYDHSQPTPRGTASTVGTYAQVNGADQTGDTINTKGWVGNQLNLLLPGDYFQIGDELKMVMETAVSNNTGLSTITFDPPIRNSPAANSNIIIEKPKCIMRLEDDGQISWDNSETILLSGLSFSCVEVFFNG